MAESHRSTSPTSSLFMPQDDHYSNEHAARRPRLSSHLALPTIRYPGDGLDFRRPVTSADTSASNSQTRNMNTEVIDLTDHEDSQESSGQATAAPPPATYASSSRASRFPRFGRDDVIDVDDDVNEASDRDPSDWRIERMRRERSSPHVHPRFSVLRRRERSELEDVEFVGERPRPRPRLSSRSNTPAFANHRSLTPYPTGLPNETIDLTADDDDIVHLDTRPRQGTNLEAPNTTAGLGTRAVPDVDFGPLFADIRDVPGRLLNHLQAGFADRIGQNQVGQQNQSNGTGEHHYRRAHAHRQMAFERVTFRPGGLQLQTPAQMQAMFGSINMNYDHVAFDLGYAGANRAPSPKYVPPPAAENGFTRSPGEDEVVVCPNCGDELGIGNSEQKQEVWVIKNCGHAYCGECSRNRSKSSAAKASKKGKGRMMDIHSPQPFKMCVVHNCGKPAGHKSMVHVFLGS